jgi:hypothetical protein
MIYVIDLIGLKIEKIRTITLIKKIIIQTLGE